MKYKHLQMWVYDTRLKSFSHNKIQIIYTFNFLFLDIYIYL